jgi:hypothetical protein
MKTKDVTVVWNSTLMCENEFIDKEIISNKCRKKACVHQATCHTLVDILNAKKPDMAKKIIDSNFNY